MEKFTARSLAKLVFCIATSECVGAAGSVLSLRAIPEWYAYLVKPALTPPSWVFGPVWTTLYLLMGVAAFLVWKKGWRKPEVKTALSVFGLQLVLNGLWSSLFFGLKNPGWALVDIILLWASIIATMFTFAKVSKIAAWILVPYLLWVSFALYLNYAIWSLN
jgi:translocator protein